MERELTLHQAKMNLLRVVDRIKTVDEVQAIQQVIVNYYAQKVQEEVDKLWDEGKINEQVIEQWGKEHMRTPYRYAEFSPNTSAKVNRVSTNTAIISTAVCGRAGAINVGENTITIDTSLDDVTEGNPRTLTPSSTPTAIDNTSISTKAVKRIVNGQLLILRGEKTYTVTGQEVK